MASHGSCDKVSKDIFMHLNDLKKQYFDGIYQTKALLIKNVPFTLKSGKQSHIYLNHRNFLSQSNYLTLIANLYHQLTKTIAGDYQLGIVDSIMSPIIVGAMSTKFNKDFVVIKKEPLKHGTQEYIYGNISKPIVLIDDMTSTGGTLIDAANKIRAKGGSVEHAIISAYRDKSAERQLEVNNIKLVSIASFDEILRYLEPHLTKEERHFVQLEHGLDI